MLQEAEARRRVVAIGLDAGELSLIRRWAESGAMPNTGRLLREGAVGEIETTDLQVAETPWTVLLTSCMPQTTGYWSPIAYSPDYTTRHVKAYEFEENRPFYAYARGRKAIILDVPQTRLDRIEGVQVLGWGAHSQQGPSVSEPAGLLDEVTGKYGAHPAYDDDWMLVPETERRGPWLERALTAGIERRARMCADLMRERDWDLVFVVFGESHSAGHAFWHLAQTDHPLYGAYEGRSGDPLANVFAALDRAIGEIVAAAPPEARIVLFASHGMKANASDVQSLVVLPELLYRDSFGKAALAEGTPGEPPPPLGRYRDTDWMHAIWATRPDRNPLRSLVRKHTRLGISRRFDWVFGGDPELTHPYDHPIGWMPLNWYQPCWPQMKAFALPSFSDGYVRLNVKGREANGRIEPADFAAECRRLTAALHALTDARTGAPVVNQVVTVRERADQAGNLPDADLIVLWRERPADVVDSPQFGRIGPVPFRRSGDHTPRGFLVAAGPDIPRRPLPKGELVDLAPTILHLLGVPKPNHFEGQSLLAV